MPLISVIVPIYKAESFLHKCIGSILSQSQSDFELILVDDGSPDNSGAICDEYARQDSRVRVIHQKNAGVSAARNRGIREAKGTYIGFVDSDDWIREDMYTQLYDAAESTRADIIMCDALTVYDSGATKVDTIQQLHQDCILTKKALYPELMLEFAGAVWRCIYRTELIRERNILFSEGLKFSEDRIFNIYAMGAANAVYYMKQPLYMRYVNAESCVHRFHPDHFLHAKLAAKETEKAIRLAWDDGEDYQRAYLRQFIDAACAAVCNISNAEKTVPFLEKISMMRQICNDSGLQDAILKSGYSGETVRWIKKKRILFLCCYNDRVKQKLLNLKEMYTQAGLKGVVRKCIQKLKK